MKNPCAKQETHSEAKREQEGARRKDDEENRPPRERGSEESGRAGIEGRGVGAANPNCTEMIKHFLQKCYEKLCMGLNLDTT